MESRRWLLGQVFAGVAREVVQEVRDHFHEPSAVYVALQECRTARLRPTFPKPTTKVLRRKRNVEEEQAPLQLRLLGIEATHLQI